MRGQTAIQELAALNVTRGSADLDNPLATAAFWLRVATIFRQGEVDEVVLFLRYRYLDLAMDVRSQRGGVVLRHKLRHPES